MPFATVRSVCVVVGVVLACATPARAQFRPASGPAPGEEYHIEAAASFWDASPSIILASESLGIPGTVIDLVEELLNDPLDLHAAIIRAVGDAVDQLFLGNCCHDVSREFGLRLDGKKS